MSKPDIDEALPELVNLYTMWKANGDAFNEAVKAVSEKAGVKPAIIKKAVEANYKGTIDEVVEDAEKLALILS